jgi:tripartite-type tricarboxylate transporter receptor subunit TctC
VNTVWRSMLAAIASTAFGFWFTIQAQAQGDPAATYPNRPIRVIVPFAAGGGKDIFARLVNAELGKLLGGQPIVIENRPGGGGRPAAEWVLNQPHDGYTLFVAASGTMSVASAAYPNLPYHPTKSFAPLAMIGDFPLFLVVPFDHPAQTVKDLADWAKKNPEKSNYGSSSPSFVTATELLKLKTGMPATMIPYKSTTEMVASVAAGHTLLAFTDGPPTLPLVQAKKVRALLPDVPSMTEAGFPDVNTLLWSGYFAGAKTPSGIVAKLESALRKAITEPSVRAKLREMAINPGDKSSKEFAAMIDKDVQGYLEVINAAKLKFQ